MTPKRAGWLLLGVVLAANPATLASSSLSSPFRDPRLVGVLLVADTIAIMAGLWLVTGRRPMPGPLLTAMTLLVSIILGEAVARFVPSFRPSPRTTIGAAKNRDRPSYFRADSEIGWRMKPHACWEWIRDGAPDSYCADGSGFRTTAQVPQDGRSGIAFIGDSFTFGTGVSADSTFAEVVSRALPATVAWNLGMPGFGVDQMLLTLRTVALPRHPALVVIAFIDQDFERSLTAYRIREGFSKPMLEIEGDTVRHAVPADRPAVPVWWLSQRSWLWRAGELAMQSAGYRSDVGRWWRLNAAALRSIQREAARDGVPTLFARLPKEDNLSSWPSLQRLMAEEGAPFLDLVDSSRGVGGLFFANDPHIDEDGHRFVAEAMLRWIRGQSRLTPLSENRAAAPARQ